MSKDSKLEKNLAAKYALVYRQLLAYFQAGFPNLQEEIEREVSKYAVWADMEIQVASIKAIEQSIEDTKKQIPHDIKAEQIVPLLSYMEKDRLPTLGKDVANEVRIGLALIGAIGVLEMFRKRMSLGLVWTRRAAKTTVTYAGRDTALLVYRAFPNIVKGWIWISALSPTTCLACIALHGSFHRPPERLNDHQSGLCRPRPVIKVLQPIETGESWFSKLDEDAQRKRMGAAKYDAWKAGKFDFRDLVGSYETPLWNEMVQEASLKGILGEAAKEWYK